MEIENLINMYEKRASDENMQTISSGDNETVMFSPSRMLSCWNSTSVPDGLMYPSCPRRAAVLYWKFWHGERNHYSLYNRFPYEIKHVFFQKKYWPSAPWVILFSYLKYSDCNIKQETAIVICDVYWLPIW